MSKNYLELQYYFPELFEQPESHFNATSSEVTEDYEANLQFKPEFGEEKQNVE